MRPNVRDASLKATKALPNGAAATSTDPIDLGLSSKADGLVGAVVELVVQAPALTTAEQPDDKTLIYDVEHSDDDSTYVPLYEAVITQTGADGAGAAAAEKRVALPSDVKRYVRVTATGSASGNSSAKSMTAELRF